MENLASVQLPADDLKQFVSITQIQTKGLKRHFHDIQYGDKKRPRADTSSANEMVIDGDKNMRPLADYMGNDSEDEEPIKERDYNRVGLEDSSSDSSESDEEKIDADNDRSFDNFVAAKVEIPTPVAAPLLKPPQPIQVVEAATKDTETTPTLKPKSKPATYIHVDRKPSIQKSRLLLPILGEEQKIMEAINEHPIVIITGETGSGKTTQVPQFLYEAGYAEKQMIGITEPRRIAAMSMANRVGVEMNLGPDIVSYLMRFEGNTTDRTKIKFMTDGVLLKEVKRDSLLRKYSVIILDEAHERSVETDILIGLLFRIIPRRNEKGLPLKVIIMSATLRVSDFTDNQPLFDITKNQVLEVAARQFEVTVHFSSRKHDNSNYMEEARKKAINIHQKLPDGGILIFVTGRKEVQQLVDRLQKAFPEPKGTAQVQQTDKRIDSAERESSKEESDDEWDTKRAQKLARSKRRVVQKLALPSVNLDNYKLPSEDADLMDDRDSDAESSDDSDGDGETLFENHIQPMRVLPLYANLPSKDQARVFETPPAGTRLCVVSTNVAETSLTIPNIKYVIDCGRQKTRLYDKVTGVSKDVVTYTSKASASQRSGRAGRTGPGHCYRLYSSAVFNNEFKEYSVPDILQKPFDAVMLQLKQMGINQMKNLSLPSKPDEEQLAVAERKLQLLGALEENKSGVSTITDLGKAIAEYPVAPRFGKMLALSNQHDLMPYTICMVAALSVPEVLEEVALINQDEEVASSKINRERKSSLLKKRMSWAGKGNSLKLGDPMVLLRAVGAAEQDTTKGGLPEFCSRNGLRQKAITEIMKIRKQLTKDILNLSEVPLMEIPTELQLKLLRQIMLSGMSDQIARRMPQATDEKKKFKYAYKTAEMEDPMYMHSASVLRESTPEFVIYQEVYEVQNKDQTKMIMRGITEIEPEWLSNYAPKLCNFEKVADSMPFYDRDGDQILQKMHVTFGKCGWELPDAQIRMPDGKEACMQFGFFFLNGDVFEKLKEYQPKLLSTPSSVLKAYNRHNPRVEAFINKLVDGRIVSRASLENVWRKNPKCKCY